MQDNICLMTDSYKASGHDRQYPPGTTKVYSYFESRGKPGQWDDEVVPFGFQYILRRLVGAVVTKKMVEQARDVWALHFSADLFNYDGWMHIVNKHGGRLPVVIRAVPEGTIVPTRNALMTIENTDPKCFWLTNWLETYLVQAWYPTTVATQSREMKKLILASLEKTGDPAGLPFKLHDFGFRGVTSLEQAAIGGAAHLVNFMGTDTMAGVMMLREHYGADMPGVSIPASEHSTITSWGEDNELAAFENMLDTYPTGLVACVSDSYDIGRACRDYWGTELKDKILSRDGTLVVRPDSGEPVVSVLSVLKALGDAFGTTANEKGFDVLPPQLRVIQGDGIDYQMLRSILSAMEREGWSADNIAFGSGGGLLQKLDRDTLQFAFKCSYIEGDGFARDVYKDPTGAPSKRSKRGRLKLLVDAQATETDGVTRYRTVSQSEPGEDVMVEVFRDGEMMRMTSFDEIKERAAL